MHRNIFRGTDHRSIKLPFRFFLVFKERLNEKGRESTRGCSDLSMILSGSGTFLHPTTSRSKSVNRNVEELVFIPIIELQRSIFFSLRPSLFNLFFLLAMLNSSYRIRNLPLSSFHKSSVLHDTYQFHSRKNCTPECPNIRFELQIFSFDFTNSYEN